MKGKLLLVPATEPKEGMLAVFKGRLINLHICADNRKFPYLPEEISQIVVEYKGLKPHTTITESAIITVPRSESYQLPLHTSNWEYALQHIGEEVNFYETPCTVNGYVYKGSPIDASRNSKLHAQLIVPTYTEEEVKALCKKAFYSNGGYSEFWKFWSHNKKK